MARKKRESEGESEFWRGYERADAMKIRKPRTGAMRSVRPKSFRPRKKSYHRRGRR